MSYISHNKARFNEGQLRTKELANYLEQLKLPKKVWICEDATGIIAKVEYDPASDQIVGIPLPMDSVTGMPISFSFMAQSVEDIQNYAKKPLSTLVYVVLALPLMPNIPPFVLQIFGTDNTFNAINVKQRWNYTVKELKKFVFIQIIPFYYLS